MSALLSEGYQQDCLWQAQVEYGPRPVNEPPGAADVVVIGAGYCGLSAAASACSAGAQVVVLDAEPLGWGASTRNGGMVIPELKSPPDSLSKKIGPLAYRLYDELLEAFAHVEAVAGDSNCDYRRSGQLYLAHSAQHVEYLRTLAQQLPDTTYLDAGEVAERIASPVFFGAAHMEMVGGLHPAKFHAALVRRAAEALICDRTAATSVRRYGAGFVVETTRGSIECRQVIVATNAYADAAVPGVAEQVLPVSSYIIATKPLSDEIQARIGAAMMVDTKNFLNYWRLTPDGRMAFGGRRSLDPVDIPVARDFLYAQMVQIHPDLAGVEVDYAWTGYVAMTRDRLPHVGTVDGAWFATGCNGSGVCLNTWLGHRLGQVVTGQAPPPAFAELKQPGIPAKTLSPVYLPLVGRFLSWQDSR